MRGVLKLIALFSIRLLSHGEGLRLCTALGGAEIQGAAPGGGSYAIMLSQCHRLLLAKPSKALHSHFFVGCEDVKAFLIF